MPACEACHLAKVRCDPGQHHPSSSSSSCMRCQRLGIECVPRISRQGQGPKSRKKNRKRPLSLESPSPKGEGGVVMDTTIQGAVGADGKDGDKPLAMNHETARKCAKSEDESLMHHFDSLLGKQQQHHQHHYGVLYLIHSWISFAFTRRSFALLGRACRLAAKCRVPMDEIFSHRRRHILDPIMLLSLTEQQQQQQGRQSKPPALQWSDLPPALRRACLVTDELSSSSSALRSQQQQRYIMIREAKNGHSRFLLSEAFQRDIASLWLIEQTWKANEKPVVKVFLDGPDDFDKFTRAIQYQMSRYTHPNCPIECVRVNGLRVKMTTPGNQSMIQRIQEMDLIYAFEIVTLEHSFYLGEFVLPKRHNTSLTVQHDDSIATTQAQAHDDALTESNDPLPLFDNLDDLVVDEDLEAFLSLINDE